MTDRLHHIGDVAAYPAGAEPVHGKSLMGDERVKALVAFRTGDHPERWDFYFAPWTGPRVRLTDPRLVDWER